MGDTGAAAPTTAGVEAPERRAYQQDGRFRRFVEVLSIELPKVELDQAVNQETGEVTNSLQWIPETRKPAFDSDGNSTKHLKECMARYNRTKEAWRRTVPDEVTSVMSALHLGPKVGATAPSLVSSDDPQLEGKKPPAIVVALKIALLIFLFSIVYMQWPLWKVLIDPEANDNYKLLGLPAGASRSDIKKAFREFAKTNHPDQGGSAAKYLRVRAAYDELLEQAESGREEEILTEEAKESNLQVIMFIGFVLGRMYQVSLSGSDFLIKLINTRNNADIAKYTQAGVHIACMALFIWESGMTFNSLMLLYNLYNYLTKLVSNDALIIPHPDNNHLKWECWKYVWYIFLPCTLLYGYQSWDVFDLVSVCRVLVGCVFVACFIHRHRPYIFVQHALGSRSYSSGHPMFSRAPILGVLHIPIALRVVLELLIDDILAYAMHVPTPFRAACFLLLFVSVVQSMVYPPLAILAWGSHEKWAKSAATIMTSKQQKDEIDQKALAKEAKKSEAAARAVEAAEREATTTSLDREERARKEAAAQQGPRQSVVALGVVAASVLGFGLLLVAIDHVQRHGAPITPEFRAFCTAMFRTLDADA
eukprot:TRINITY_DN14500_c0_g1_i1.p1 TRINITY_DN14500_c0_g1~~TRINITY_DN14500_c0_g1_i1.p1  ORF type:complete len:591 (+),score=225.04 TRINITY_DN14500_c0_g1_i1:150-1922(+)